VAFVLPQPTAKHPYIYFSLKQRNPARSHTTATNANLLLDSQRAAWCFGISTVI